MTTETYLLLGFVILGVAVIYTMFARWQRQVEKTQAMQMEQMERQAAGMRTLTEQTIMFQHKTQEEARNRDFVGTETAGLESGGYIIFNMPDSKKSLFHDLLKGFEEYAKLRGYVINFSIDNSFSDKVAFKFTLDSAGINVSTKQVKQDLQDYINKVQRGDSLDDLPMVLSPEEHSTLLACMKNRISFLQHSYNLQKTATDFYMGLLKQVPSLSSGVFHPQNFYIGDGNQNHNLQALGSPQAAVGTGNRLIGNRIDESIHIANSFNDRTEQVQALSSLWSGLYDAQKKLDEKDPDREPLNKAMRNVSDAEKELKEQDPPDPKRISRWLETAKRALLTLALTEEVQENARKVWELFHMH